MPSQVRDMFPIEAGGDSGGFDVRLGNIVSGLGGHCDRGLGEGPRGRGIGDTRKEQDARDEVQTHRVGRM